jgi:thymidylate synthase ThyX
MITAKILLDSLNPAGDRITTFLLTYPRIIHAEFMTHRVFSRNASSTRAIPTRKIIEAVKENPFIPTWWGKNEPGMKAREELDDTIADQFRNVDGKMVPLTRRAAAKHDWLVARDSAVAHAERLVELGLHKQIAGRVLEPFSHITVIVTGTEFENFFALRAHEDAQPEIQELARIALDLYNINDPRRLKEGEWHIPFGDKMPEGADLSLQLTISTARCARLSYLTFDGAMNVEKDIEIHDDLSTNGHWSPFEHQAQALGSSIRVGNFTGWKQYRKTFVGENRRDKRVKTFKAG